ncbi:MAG TPA: hypothetical protein VJC03_09095 [bacterium]|nr:hypothetical protein [bacterium]
MPEEPVFRKIAVEIHDVSGTVLEGIISLPKGGYHSRLSDYLNDPQRNFVVLTSVIIQGEPVRTYRSLIINRSTILYIIEREEKLT